MKRILGVLLLSMSISFSSCSFLDVVPENDIETVETIFEKREGALEWLKTCYVYLRDNVGSVVDDPSYTGADELVAGNFQRQTRSMAGLLIGDGLQLPDNPYGDLWHKDKMYAGIHYCNIFIENIDRVYNMAQAEKDLWTAEIKALKAHMYYILMQYYGPIVLVPKNIELTDDVATLLVERSPLKKCVEETVTLLDDAIEILPTLGDKEISRRAYHSKESAAALKAKVLLLYASPLFNGNSMYVNLENKLGEKLIDTDYDSERWKAAAEAADVAVAIAEAAGRELISGSISKATPLLNTMYDLELSSLAFNFESSEAIFMMRRNSVAAESFPFYAIPPIENDDLSSQYHVSYRGSIAPSMKMVEMYYTENGLPINSDKTWNHSNRYEMGRESDAKYNGVVPTEEYDISADQDVLNLHLKREPRFYANIGADRLYWQRGTEKKDNLQIKTRQGELFGTKIEIIDEKVGQNLTGYWLRKGIYSHVTGRDYITQILQREEPIVLIRLAEIYLIQAEAWNEYEGPSSKVFNALDKIRKRAGLIGVEEAWLNYSNNTIKLTTKDGVRDVVQQEWNIEFAFEGHRFWNLRRWLKAHIELNEHQFGWNITGDTAESFYNQFDIPIAVWTKRKFNESRDYLFPIRTEEKIISGVTQNPGW